MDCVKEQNAKNCSCSYPSCPRKGACCACVKYHIEKGQIPGCFFSPDAEKTFDRSIDNFAKSLGYKR